MSQFLTQSLGQHMRLEQRLTPQLIQSMNILQLNSMALEQRVAEELEKNYALEQREPDPSERASADRLEPARGDVDEARSFERLNRLYNEYGSDESTFRGRKPAFEERDSKMDAMANTASRPASLAEHLLLQWHVLDLDEEMRRAGEAIIYSLEDDGYLRVRLEEVAEGIRPAVELAVLEEALKRVQRLEPVGIAARDYQECLLVQLDALPGDNAIEKALVSKYLDDVVRNRYPAIAKATGYSIGEITEAVRAMKSTLNLHPAYTVIERDTPPITPDVMVEYGEGDGSITVRLTKGNSPRLHVRKEVVEMLKDKSATKEVRDFARGHVESASALIDAIKFRRERLLAVSERIIEHQREFFEIGPQGLGVLRMSDLAEELECDPSTISRTVAGKYMQTPRGIFPLRYFFPGGTETSEGESTSWDSVKIKVKEIVEKEDRSKPLNDDQIAEKLRGEGVEISRRTVAKYRQQLNIPAARQRKEY